MPINAKLVANLITKAGANRVLSIDLHAAQIQGFFDIPVDHLYARPVLMEKVREMGAERPVIVSPDVGGTKLARAYAKDAIRVNGILLGWFDTEGERAFYSAAQIAEQSARTIPAGRAGDPGEAASLIAYLASDHAAYVTGSLMRIDGGFSLVPDLST